GIDDDLDDDGCDAGSGEQGGDSTHPEGKREAALFSGFGEVEFGLILREVDLDDVEHGEPEYDEEDGDADVEPESAVDGSELAAGEDDDEAEHAVNDGHGEAVRAAEEETAKLRLGLCARADDGEVDGYEGQDA